jgi:hypothetical protein
MPKRVVQPSCNVRTGLVINASRRSTLALVVWADLREAQQPTNVRYEPKQHVDLQAAGRGE